MVIVSGFLWRGFTVLPAVTPGVVYGGCNYRMDTDRLFCYNLVLKLVLQLHCVCKLFSCQKNIECMLCHIWLMLQVDLKDKWRNLLRLVVASSDGRPAKADKRRELPAELVKKVMLITSA